MSLPLDFLCMLFENVGVLNERNYVSGKSNAKTELEGFPSVAAPYLHYRNDFARVYPRILRRSQTLQNQLPKNDSFFFQANWSKTKDRNGFWPGINMDT